MAVFKYNALTSAGRLMTGTVEAGSPEEAAQTLQQMSLNVNSLEKAKAEQPRTAVGRSEFLLFNQQLASIARAGVPLERGLRELAHDITSKGMRRADRRHRGRPGEGRADRGGVPETREAFPASVRAHPEGGRRDRPAQRDAHEPQPPPRTGRPHAAHHPGGRQLSRRHLRSGHDHHHGRLRVRDPAVPGMLRRWWAGG